MIYSFKTLLIAPCGMNCSICTGYLRRRNKCPGCRLNFAEKPVTRANCKIKNCPNFSVDKKKFCFQCKEFPCERLIHLDKRYKTKYRMSMIDNLEYIKKFGIKKFILNENIRWTCSNCGGTICVHKRFCYSCGKLS